MTLDKRAAILAAVDQSLSEDFETLAAEQDGQRFVRCLLPLFDDGTGKVLMDIFALDYNEHFDLIQLYTTMILQPGPGLEKLRGKLGEWNFYASAGSYGIYEEAGQLYHKYNVIAQSESSVDRVVSDTFAAVCVCMDEMADHLMEAIHISNGRE